MCVGFPEWTAQFSAWKTAWKDGSEACAIACQTAQFTHFFRQVWSQAVKSLSLAESV